MKAMIRGSLRSDSGLRLLTDDEMNTLRGKWREELTEESNQRLYRKNHRRKRAAEEKRGMRKAKRIKKRPPTKDKISLDLEGRRKSQRRRGPRSGVAKVRPENKRKSLKLGQSRLRKGPAR